MTFTNRAAFEMRDRVSGAAGPDCALPDVGNLHHFYHRTGTLRLDAATFLAAQGITRWDGIVRGASTDFVRLQSVADDEHEETIRAILVKKNLPDEYERRLRMIIFARAKRNPKV